MGNFVFRSRIVFYGFDELIEVADNRFGSDFEFSLFPLVFIVIPFSEDDLSFRICFAVGSDVLFVSEVMIKSHGSVLVARLHNK